MALPCRLERAVDVLDRQPEVGLVHSAYVRWLPDGTLLSRFPPTTHTGLRLALLFGNVVCHASVTVRASVLARMPELYRDVAGPQDYDLWLRLVNETAAVGIDDPLVVYRQSSMAMSRQFESEIDQVVAELSDQQLANLVTGAPTASLRRLYRFEPAAPADWTAVRSLRRLFDVAATQLPDLDPREVRQHQRAWTSRATRSWAARRGTIPTTPRFLWQIVRTDPGGALDSVRRAVLTSGPRGPRRS